MSDPSLALIDPLIQEAAPRSVRRSKHLFRLLSPLISLCLAVLLCSETFTYSGGGQHSAVNDPSIAMALQRMQLMKETPVRQQVRTNGFFKQFGGGGQKTAPNPPVLISQDYKFAAGTVLTTAAIAAIPAPLLVKAPFLAFFGALGAILTVQSGRVVFSFDDKAFEVKTKGAGGDIQDSGENFAVGGENRWDYKTFTRWGFIPSESFPLFTYFYETQTRGANDEQFHLFPVIMNSAELSETMKAKVGADKIQPITFDEFIEGAKSADRVG